MNWYKIAKLYKKASLTLYIDKYERNHHFDTIHNIGWELNSLLFYKWMDTRDKAYFSEFHKVPSSDTITMDGLDVDNTTGTINFYIDGISPDKVDGILEKIKSFLTQNNVKIGPLVKNTSKMYGVPVVRIPIISNPKGESSQTEDRPPEINMANNNAFFIFNNVLKYNVDLWDTKHFDVAELKKRIEYFEGEENLPEGPYAGQNGIVAIEGGNVIEGLPADFLNGKNALSTYDEQQVRDRIREIKILCDWAINHGFSEIYAA